jgi:flagellar hook-associated protein 3 FlgL
MRVTEHRLAEIATSRTTANRERLAEAEAKVSTGTRVSRPSQDLVSWAEGKRADARLIANKARADHTARAKERLAEVDRVLDGIGRSLDRSRELAVMGANATTDADTRAMLAVELRSLREGALQLANTRDAAGQYLLSGTATGTAPFNPTTGAWQGNNTAVALEVGEGRTQVISVSGEVLTAPFGVDVLAMLDSLATALAANDLAAVQAGVGSLDTAVGQVADARSREVGVRMSALADADHAREDLDLSLTALRARATEADAIGAAAELASGMNALDTVRTVAQRILRMMDVT